MSYKCSVCAETHDDLPDLGLDRPDFYWTVPEAERTDRIELSDDICIIDEEHFFIRGVLEIPIHDYPQRFGFGVWVSQKRENFATYLENYDSSNIDPFFGWLSTNIGYYRPETLLLKTMVHFRGNGLRPAIELEPTEHPLSLDYHNGITLDKAWEIVHYYLNPPEPIN